MAADSGFRMAREYFGLKLEQSMFVWPIQQSIVSWSGGHRPRLVNRSGHS
jgi:hypothetical protein